MCIRDRNKRDNRMRKPQLVDYMLLTLLSLIWASAFFNIKIATYSFGPITIGFLRSFLGAIPVLILCFYKNIKIEAFSKDWKWFAIIGLVNLVIPFILISYGVNFVQSNLAAILMSTTPLSSTVLAHFFLKGEKFNLLKTIGLLIGFSGIVFLFSDDFLINENNFVAALLILLGSTCYVIGGVITLKISNKENENVTGSILIWSTIILLPFSIIFEKPWMLNPSTDSIISVIYLGIFPTGIAWLLRFRILKTNGLIFHSQVSYIIPIFGIILGYIFLNEIITSKIIVALIAVFIGIYLAKYIPINTAIRATIILDVIISFRNMYPKIIPNIGIIYETCEWNIRPFVFKILNLNNHAIPVGNIPKYITDIMESVEGFNIHGFSKIIENGRSIIVDQIKIEPVTFSFSLLLIFKVITPPIT